MMNLRLHSRFHHYLFICIFSLYPFDAFTNKFFMFSFLQAVELWLVDKAVVPIESSVAGSIHRNYDLLLRHKLHIVGEVQLQVDYCLLGLAGAKREDLKCVVSHPQVRYQIQLLFILLTST